MINKIKNVVIIGAGNVASHLSRALIKKIEIKGIISKNKVGLDIEIISEKPLRLTSKFISNDSHNPLSEEKATLIWCCKEAVFKWHQKGNVDFITDIKIKPFIIKEKGQLIAVFKKQKLSLYYKKIEMHFLAYVCK